MAVHSLARGPSLGRRSDAGAWFPCFWRWHSFLSRELLFKVLCFDLECTYSEHLESQELMPWGTSEVTQAAPPLGHTAASTTRLGSGRVASWRASAGQADRDPSEVTYLCLVWSPPPVPLPLC